MPNQNPEQIARDEIDMQLLAYGWLIQSKKNINLKARKGNSPCFIFENSNWNSGSLGRLKDEIGMIKMPGKKIKQEIPCFNIADGINNRIV